MVYLVGDLENAKAFMLMKYGTKGFYDRSYNLIANKHLAPCYPLDGRNLYKVVKLDEDFLNDLVIVIVPFTHIASMAEEHRTKLNNILKSYKDWQNLDPYQARLVVDRLLSSKDVKSDSDLKQLQKNVTYYSTTAHAFDFLASIRESKEKAKEDTSYPRMKPLATGSNPTKPKPKKVDFVKRCDYDELVTLVNNPRNYKKITSVDDTYFSDFDGSPYKLSNFLTKYFGSEYWNLPVKGYRLDYNGKFFAGSVSIDVTSLSTSVLVNGYHFMREDWGNAIYINLVDKIDDCYQLYRNSKFSFKDAIPLKYTPLTLFNFSNRLTFTNEGIFLEVGLVNVPKSDLAFIALEGDCDFYYHESPVGFRGYRLEKLYKKDTRTQIQEWKSTHQKVVERAKYGESEWLHRDLSEIVTPQPNTKIIYVCYLPETGVIKVGRTRNWGSRKGVYSRFKGDSKLTSGIMRLCYYWNVISTGDEVVDRFLMYCAEDHLKLLANHRMRVVEGKEFFRGYDLNDFIREVRSYFESLSVSRLISIRDTSKIKRFCSGESYDYDRLMQRLQELKEKNQCTTSKKNT